ncbi:hypothetical protein C8Q77DRAFT_1156349 [Trametes polyzona]|nr:hypothetical protein C8Q77DRAFT_1156349 [Trametes polyzona]
MNTFKPKVSDNSRIHGGYGRATRTRKGPAEDPKRKKALERDVGKLTEVLNLPLDVFFEIASHLHLVDILQLARTSKELRAILLSPACRHLWVAARRNIAPPLPECPSYMTENRYARLVFERVCDACGVGRSVNVDYAIPARFCGACWKANVRNGGKLAREAGLKKAAQGDVFNLLPMAALASYHWNTEPITTLSQTSSRSYYEPEFASVAKEYIALRNGTDKKALEEFVEQRKANALMRFNFNLSLAEREKTFHQSKHALEESIEQERIAAIQANLRVLGYEPSEYPQGNWEFRQMLHQPRKLTTRIWNTIRPKLIEILDAQRERRADEAFKAKWQKRQAQLAAHYKTFLQKDREQKRLFPGFEDAMLFCRDLLVGAEPDNDVSENEYAQFEALVLANADAYRARVLRDLAGLVLLLRAGLANRGPWHKKVVKKAKGKGKGKAKAKATASDDSDDDSDEVSARAHDMAEEDVLAILESPNVVFQCNCNMSGDCTTWKPYLGHIEHFQDRHGSRLWTKAKEGNLLQVRELDMETVKRMLEALGLPEDATSTTVRETVLRCSAECSCGGSVTRGQQYDQMMPAWYSMWFKLYVHTNRPHDGNDQTKPLEHKIVLKPSDNGA